MRPRLSPRSRPWRAIISLDFRSGTAGPPQIESLYRLSGFIELRFIRRGRWDTGRQGRHIRIWPPEDVSPAAQNTEIPNAANLFEELSTGFNAHGILGAYMGKHGGDSGTSIEMIVSVLARE